MSSKEHESSKAEMLASLVTGQGETNYVGASVQRSHRFPLHLFVKIENMARMGDMPVSLIINDLLEIGLDAAVKELPEDAAKQVARITKDQMERPTVLDKFDTNRLRGA
ncbi:MAG TPA: hypothetical protein VKS43_12030 [Burkholderiales bacterium]|nr:hypothetical protein [Burkholderiales bacterium]